MPRLMGIERRIFDEIPDRRRDARLVPSDGALDVFDLMETDS